MGIERPKAALVVTASERETLERWARRPKTAQAIAQRARIVLACATGASNTIVATRHEADGWEVARPVRGPAAGRTPG